MTRRLPGKHILYPFLAAAAILLTRLALLPMKPVPMPAVHDEFSYLLACDTFSHGRVTNSPHPLWEFFESFHVLQQPTYMSMYPPMQGLILAFGKVCFGHPWWGVLLSVGALCGLACWMMQAWVSPGWALAGSLLLGSLVGLTHYWINSYWGGAAAAIGGCLVFGAAARLGREGPVGPTMLAVLMAAGIAILANSRPWEGALVSAPLALFFLHWVVRSGHQTLRWRLTRVLLPWLLMLAAAGAAMSYYCWRITGNTLQLPYQLQRRTYAVAPVFIWEPARAKPVYRHEVMDRFYTDWEPHFEDADRFNSLRGWCGAMGWRVNHYRNFFLPALCSLALLASFVRPHPRWVLVAALTLFFAGTSLQRYFLFHYGAPVLGLAVAVPVIALSRISTLRWRGRRGRAVAIGGVLLTLALLGPHQSRRLYTNPEGFAQQRMRILRELESASGRHVVLVRYSRDHDPSDEWVYNAADIDNAKVVWARIMWERENERLFGYYRSRQFWLLEADSSPIRLTRIP